MAAKLGTLTLDLVAKTGNFTGPIDKARKKAGESFTKIRNGVNTSAKAFAGLATAATAGLTVLISKGLAAADAQAKTARAIGATSAGLASLERAANRAGISTDTLRNAAEKINQRLGEAIVKGTGPAAEALDRLGLSAQELSKLDVDERFAAIAARTKELGLSSQQTAFFLRELGVRSAAVANLFEDGGKSIEDSRKKLEAYGATLSSIDENKIESANDAFDELGIITDGLQKQLAVQFAPVIEAVAQAISDASIEAGGLGNVAINTFETVVNGAAFVVNAADGIGRAFSIAANLIVVTFAGALDIVVGGIATILEIIDKIPTIRLLVDDSDIAGLRAFQNLQKGVAREGLAEIKTDLETPLAGDQFLKFIDDAKAKSESAAKALQDQRDSAEVNYESVTELAEDQETAQKKLNKELKETAKIIAETTAMQNAASGGVDPFTQQVNLAKSQIVSGSSFLGSSIEQLKQLVDRQARSGRDPDSIAGRRQIIEQLEAGQLPTASGNSDGSPLGDLAENLAKGFDLATQALEVSKLIEQNTRVVAEAQAGKVEPVGTLNLTVAGPNGQMGFEGQIQADQSTIEKLKSLIDEYTNDQARAAAGG